MRAGSASLSVFGQIERATFRSGPGSHVLHQDARSDASGCASEQEQSVVYGLGGGVAQLAAYDDQGLRFNRSLL